MFKIALFAKRLHWVADIPYMAMLRLVSPSLAMWGEWVMTTVATDNSYVSS